jgi:long-chain acyl-CoA synthetase
VSVEIAANLSPEPILRAAESYRGSIVDVDRSLVFDWGALARARDNLTKQLKAAGLAVDDRVIVAVSNGAPFLTALTAILACEAAPLLVHAQTPPSELKRTALRHGARYIVGDLCDDRSLETVSAGIQVITCEPWLRLACAEIDPAEPGFVSPSLPLGGVPLHPTSGSTGTAKVALRPGECAVAEAEHYIETLGITPHDAILALPPMSHAYGYGMCAMVPLVSGATIVCMSRFHAPQVRRALRDQPITIFPAAPAMLDALSFGTGVQLHNRMRWVLSAGSLLSERTAREFKDKTGMTVRPLYGTTETGGISVATDAETLHSPGHVGSPMKGVSVQVRATQDSAALGEGVGRLSVQSSSMMAGYLRHDERIAVPMVDGWFETGDLAKLGTASEICLKGRESEVINVCGMKVVPSEVEEVLAGLPNVREVKVYSGQLRSGSQIVKAAVAADGTIDVSWIRAYCEQHLVYYKRPQIITLVDSLPRSPAGKILRDQLP